MTLATPDLEAAIDTVIGRCLAVSADEQVLVIADTGTRALGDVLRDGAVRAGADVVLALMDERATDGSEPPIPITAALAACDVYLAPTSRSLSHTTARKHATDRGVRGATMPRVTPDMLARMMSVDFERLTARTRALTTLLSRSETARLTCPRGSEMTLDLTGRLGVSDDGDLRDRGAFGNLPCGEAFIAPRSGNGKVAVSSLAALGISDPPAVLEVRDGHLVGADHGFGPMFLEALRQHGRPGTNLAELGIGTNGRARLTGNILEDEKLLGSVHVAFGASAGIGGTVAVPIHLDAIVIDASLWLDDRPVLNAGRLELE